MAVIRSGRELLAATRAAGGKHLAAADSGRAGAEAVAAGADKVAGLEGALHDNLENRIKRAAAEATASQGRAVKRPRAVSQGIRVRRKLAQSTIFRAIKRAGGPVDQTVCSQLRAGLTYAHLPNSFFSTVRDPRGIT